MTGNQSQPPRKNYLTECPESTADKNAQRTKSRESKSCKFQRLFGGSNSPPKPSKLKRNAKTPSNIKCKMCRLGNKKSENLPKPHPSLLQQELATCSYIILDELDNKCPVGHWLDAKIASINRKSGLVTAYCLECKITIYMKNNILPRIK